MLSKTELKKILPSLPRVSVHGPWSRVLAYHLLQGPPPGAPPNGPAQPLWSGGAPMNGQRFTPKDSFGAIYLASDPVTALKEVQAIFSPPNFPPFTLRIHPQTVFAVEGIVSDVLDLNDQHIQNQLSTSLQELTGDWQVQQHDFLHGRGDLPKTQILGQAAYDSGVIRGLQYRATKNLPDGIALAIFADRLGSPNFLQVYDRFGHLSDRRP